MGKNLRNRSERKSIWVQHMHKGKWADYRDFASVLDAEAWVRAMYQQRDRHAGTFPPDGYRIREGRKVISGYWTPPPMVEPGGWVNVAGVGSVRPMLARVYAESILRACDEAEGKKRVDSTMLIDKALKVAMHWSDQDGINAAVIDELAHEADRYWEDLKTSIGKP